VGLAKRPGNQTIPSPGITRNDPPKSPSATPKVEPEKVASSSGDVAVESKAPKSIEPVRHS